ncbi:hypothetical protein M885DRAFT_296049 [Pelagophyceae sp. CCMP2097]|nr:hypothetical protein M885DRAFT_296049 [Pelagophyceae sp. CCMP2097]
MRIDNNSGRSTGSSPTRSLDPIAVARRLERHASRRPRDPHQPADPTAPRGLCGVPWHRASRALGGARQSF